MKIDEPLEVSIKDEYKKRYEDVSSLKDYWFDCFQKEQDKLKKAQKRIALLELVIEKIAEELNGTT